MKLFFGTFLFVSCEQQTYFRSSLLAFPKNPKNASVPHRLSFSGLTFIFDPLLRYYSHLHLSFPQLLTVAFLSWASFGFWSKFTCDFSLTSQTEWDLVIERLRDNMSWLFQGWWTFYVRWGFPEETHVKALNQEPMWRVIIGYGLLWEKVSIFQFCSVQMSYR